MSDLYSQIRHEIAAMRSRLDFIEARLEKATQTSSQERHSAPSQPSVTASSSPSEPRYAEGSISQTSSDSQSMETGKIMGIIGVVCILLAVAFLIKMTIDSGWFTPQRQVMASFGLGSLLLMAGGFYLKRDESYFSLLFSGGLIVLLLATFGGHYYAEMYSNKSALMMTVGINAIALTLYWTLRFSASLWIAVLGAYLCPVILMAGRWQASVVDYMIYFTAWNLTFSLLSLFIQRRLPSILASYFSIWSFYLLATILFEVNLDLLLFQVFQFFTFVLAILAYSLRHRVGLTQTESWALFPSLFSFYGVSYSYLHLLMRDEAPYLALAFAFVLLGLYFVARNRLDGVRLESAAMLNSFATIVLLHTTLFVIPESWNWVPWISLFYIALFIGFLKSLRVDHEHKPFLIGVLFCFGLSNLILFLGYDFNSVTELALLGFIYGIVSLGIAIKNERKEFSYFLLLVAHAQALIALYRLAELIPDGTRFFVSLFWVVYAFLVLGFGYLRKDRILARSSLAVFGLTGAKALLYDVSSSEPLIRVACFLILGAGLFLGGYVFRRISEWRD